jgi:hypothetical protein
MDVSTSQLGTVQHFLPALEAIGGSRKWVDIVSVFCLCRTVNISLYRVFLLKVLFSRTKLEIGF